MPTATYTPIASTTLSSTQTTVTFNNLNTVAAGMRDLILVVQTNDTTSASNILLRMNGDTASNYLDVRMGGDGSTTISTTGATTFIRGTQYATATTAIGHNSIWHFFDFAQTDKHKTVLVRASNSNVGVDAVAGRWASTSAITSISLLNANFAAGSTFSLYGVIA